MKQANINQTYTPQKKGAKLMFQSKFGEFFTKTNPFVAISLFILAGIVLSLYAFFSDILSGIQILVVFPLGVLSFTLVEYFVHRYVFHMDITTRIREKLQYGAHGVHHEYPNDLGRIVMPPILSIPLASILFFIAFFVSGKWAFAFMAGFFTGYGFYLFVHYIVHAWKMPNNALKTLWIYHNIHHFKDEDVAFGVTSHLWDKVFGTMPEVQAGKTKK